MSSPAQIRCPVVVGYFYHLIFVTWIVNQLLLKYNAGVELPLRKWISKKSTCFNGWRTKTTLLILLWLNFALLDPVLQEHDHLVRLEIIEYSFSLENQDNLVACMNVISFQNLKKIEIQSFHRTFLRYWRIHSTQPISLKSSTDKHYAFSLQTNQTST